MKKKEIILVLFLIILLQTVSAQTDNEKISKAVLCLDHRVNNTAVSQLSLEEAIFSSLARVPGNKSMDKINAEKNPSAYCWPSAGCNVKETAQVAIAKYMAGQNVTNITNWLREQVGFSEDLTWYLQITISDNKNATCFVNYEGDTDYQIQIDEKTQISGNPGACLEIHGSKYRLLIHDNCINKQFNVRCEGEFTDFKTNLLYEESAGGTLFVSSKTHSGVPESWTRENISAKCFKQNGKCDYEGTLWGAAALYVERDITEEFAPYLKALASSNEKYFPDSFLYYVLQREGKGAEIQLRISESLVTRPNGGYWQALDTPYGVYYDTSLGILALGTTNSIAEGSAKPYLLDVQGESGCWNNDNIRDTAFILYSTEWWKQRTVSQSCGNGLKEGTEQCDDGNLKNGDGCSSSCTLEGPAQCGNGVVETGEDCDCGADNNCTSSELNGKTCLNGGYEGGTLGCYPTGQTNGCDFNYIMCTGEGGTINDNSPGGTLTDCELEGYYCVTDDLACLEAGGLTLQGSQYVCATHTNACCTVPVQTPSLQSCAAQGGNVCTFDEICDTSPVQSSDGPCCLGRCQFTTSDDSGTDGSTDGASDGSTPSDEGGSGWIVIVILLIVLIALAILGIVFKDKLRVWWFKLRGKSKSSKVIPGGPHGLSPLARRAPPSFFAGPPRNAIVQPRMMPQRPMQQQRPLRNPVNNKDKEMEETLNKLKKISE